MDIGGRQQTRATHSEPDLKFHLLIQNRGAITVLIAA